MIAVVLARGIGRRMRAAQDGATLSETQRVAADGGAKAMMPMGNDAGRPFLDFALSALADAGYTEVCLVVPPDHDAIRDYYRARNGARLRVQFAVQAEPTGTAAAVLAAAPAVGTRPFLVVNGDNLYPPDAVRSLAALDGCGLGAFTRASLVEDSGFALDRVARFAALEADADGYLASIREKPDPAEVETSSPLALFSMNLWRMDATVFAACRDVPRSERGEYELPDAVMLAVARGTRFRVQVAHGAVLDLTSRGDIARVSRRLAGVDPRL